MRNTTEHRNPFLNNKHLGLLTAVIALSILFIGWLYLEHQYTKRIMFSKPAKLSFCEKVDSILRQQKRRFRDIKEEAYLIRQDTDILYRSSINLSPDSSDIIYRNEDKQLYYRGYFKNNYDSIASVRLFDSMKAVITNCLPTWKIYNLVDVERIFPFTRFIKDSTQIELYYMKNGIYDNTYTVGMVVEEFK